MEFVGAANPLATLVTPGTGGGAAPRAHRAQFAL
jgi:hypothetical protein